MLRFLLGKIIIGCDEKACDAYFNQENIRKEYLDKFVLALKAFSKNKIELGLKYLNEITEQNMITEEDELMPIKMTKDLEAIKKLIHVYDSKYKSNTFDGEMIIKMIEFIKESFSQSPTSKTEKTPPTAKPDKKKGDDYGVGEKLSLSADPEIIKRDIQRILDKVSENLTKNIGNGRDNIFSLKNQIYRIQYEINNYRDLKNALEEFKENLDEVLDLGATEIKKFRTLYNHLNEVAQSDTNNKYSTKIKIHGDHDDFLVALIHKKIHYNYKLSSAEKMQENLSAADKSLKIDRYTYNLGGKEANFIEILYSYIKSHYYYTIKDIIYDKLQSGNFSFAEKQDLINFVFGTGENSFDPYNDYTSLKGSASNYKLLNQYAGRKFLRSKKISKHLTEEQITKIKNTHEIFPEVDISEIDKPSKALRALLAVTLTIGLATSFLAIRKSFLEGGCRGGGGGSTEETDTFVKKAPNKIKVPLETTQKEEKKTPPKEEKEQKTKTSSKNKSKSSFGIFKEPGNGEGNGTGTGDGDGNGDGAGKRNINTDNSADKAWF